MSRYVNAKDFGAKGDGIQDDSVFIANAIESISTSGGVVFLPPGIYRMCSGITVKTGITIEGTTTATTGPWQNFLDASDKGCDIGIDRDTCGTQWLDKKFYKGTWILAENGEGDINSDPTFSMQGNTAIRKIGFVNKFSPPVSKTLTPCPPVIGAKNSASAPYCRDGITVEDISLANCYYGIAFYAGDDLACMYEDEPVGVSHGRHRIHNIMGAPLYCGILVKGILDTIDIHNIQFNYSCYEKNHVAARAQNATDILIGRADGINMSNVLSFGAYHGFKTVPAFDARTVSVRMSNINLEGCVPLSITSNGVYEASNVYLLTLNFAANLGHEKFRCFELKQDAKCIHQPFYVFNNFVCQNSFLGKGEDSAILDVELVRNSTVTLTNSQFWGWNGESSVVHFKKAEKLPASLVLSNVTFTSDMYEGHLAKVSGEGLQNGDLRFVSCRIPKAFADEADKKIWFDSCVTFDKNGSNTCLSRCE